MAAVDPAAGVPVLHEAGDLQLLLEGFPIPSADSVDKFRLPTDEERNSFRAALQHILDGDLQAAADEAVDANYEVVSYTDSISGDVFTLLREKESNQHWGGLYIFDQSPERRLVLQNPHPRYDGVRVPAIDLFLDTGAVAYFQAGTHRNNSPTEIDCDGDLGGDPYRVSDMAHSPGSLLQAAHEVVEDHFAQTVSLSFHGMADSSDPADVVLSNGTPHEFVGNSLSRDLAARMNEILADAMDSRVAVSHQEPGENPGLSGSTNVQGRVTNGSPTPCTVAAPGALFPERFLHLECDPDVRDGPASNWAFIVQALNELIPLFSDPVVERPLGDLVITEFMANPDQVGDGSGEYIELFNNTGAPIDMTGWTIGDRGGNSATFDGVIAPGDLFVVGVSADLNGAAAGGIPDAVWQNGSGDLTLTNSGDTISVIDADGELVASVSYYDGDPFGVGVALELMVGTGHPSGQTVEADYVASATPFGSDHGSPGVRGTTQFVAELPSGEIILSGEPPEITYVFNTQSAVTYKLWTSPDLEDWSVSQALAPVIGDGDDGSFIFPIPDEEREFYRLGYGFAAPE